MDGQLCTTPFLRGLGLSCGLAYVSVKGLLSAIHALLSGVLVHTVCVCLRIAVWPVGVIRVRAQLET
eukprot:6472272-Amphidinium_carterae.2